MSWFAQSELRHFEWGRVHEPNDWVLPLFVFAIVGFVTLFIYRRDTLGLSLWARILLPSLRIGALVLLIIAWAAPQWRIDREVTERSVVPILVDTSSSMALREDTAGDTTRHERVLELFQSDWLTQLREKHDTVIYGFDQSLRELVWIRGHSEDRGGIEPQEPLTIGQSTVEAPMGAWLGRLEPNGKDTRLGVAIEELLRQRRDDPIAGVVIVSDGAHNAGTGWEKAVRSAAESGFVFHSFGLGPDQPEVSVQIIDLQAPTQVFPGDPLTVTAYVQSLGQPGLKIDLTLKSSHTGKPGPDKNASVIAKQPGEAIEVPFELKVPSTGLSTFQLEVRATTTNQEQIVVKDQCEVDVVDRKMKILLFAGGPSRDYRFARDMMYRDRSIELDVYMQSARPGAAQDADHVLLQFPGTLDELSSYDCIVSFDPDWTQVNSEQMQVVEEWVARQAGGLVLIAGPVFSDVWTHNERCRPLLDLSPVVFQERLTVLNEGQFSNDIAQPLAITDEGHGVQFLNVAGDEKESDELWSRFPGVFGHYPVKELKRTAECLVRLSGMDDEAKSLYIASQYFGAGRVVYMGSGEIWRLRRESINYFESFYVQLTRYVAQGKRARRNRLGTLTSTRQRYSLGEIVELQAQLRDSSYRPLVIEEIVAEMKTAQSKSSRIKFIADPHRPGSYTGRFSPREEGKYSVELLIPGTEEVLRRSVRVELPNRERIESEQNKELLQSIADMSGGSYQSGIVGADALIDRIPDKARIVVLPLTPDSLWDRPWFIVTAVSLLGLEWLLRKAIRLA